MIDYKKIINKRETRLAILSFLSFIPDRWMVSMQYRLKTGRKLNLKNPQRFTEKLQWYKLNYRDPLMAKCVDKADAREYVSDCGLSDILIPLIGVYEHVEDIDFDVLPQQFVMKNTLGGGGNSVIIVKNKKELNWDETKKRLQSWLDVDSHRKDAGREWPYYSGKQCRIIIEAYLEADAEAGGLIDYKFLSFSGKTQYLYVIADRELGNGAGFGFFDSNFQRLPYCRTDELPLKRDIKKPENFEKMIQVAEILSKPFPHARIDLYNQNGVVYFGEITFFDGSGYMIFQSDEFDYILGPEFEIPHRKKDFKHTKR